MVIEDPCGVNISIGGFSPHSCSNLKHKQVIVFHYLQYNTSSVYQINMVLFMNCFLQLLKVGLMCAHVSQSTVL